MQEYRIDKLRRPVHVFLTDGRSLAGEVFLQPIARLHASPEEPGDLLNAEEPFFVFSEATELLVLAKEQVARLETAPPEADNPQEFPNLGIIVEITLADGTVESGCIFPETPASRARLVDYLNTLDQQFLAVYSPDKVCLVNRRLIVSVRQLS